MKGLKYKDAVTTHYPDFYQDIPDFPEIRRQVRASRFLWACVIISVSIVLGLFPTETGVLLVFLALLIGVPIGIVFFASPFYSVHLEDKLSKAFSRFYSALWDLRNWKDLGDFDHATVDSVLRKHLHFSPTIHVFEQDQEVLVLAPFVLCFPQRQFLQPAQPPPIFAIIHDWVDTPKVFDDPDLTEEFLADVRQCLQGSSEMMRTYKGIKWSDMEDFLTALEEAIDAAERVRKDKIYKRARKEDPAMALYTAARSKIEEQLAEETCHD